MSEEKSPLPKTADQIDAQLEERFWDELQESRCHPVTERFDREYFNEAPRENVSPHMFAMVRDAVAVSDSARLQRSEAVRNGIAAASPLQLQPHSGGNASLRPNTARRFFAPIDARLDCDRMPTIVCRFSNHHTEIFIEAPV